MEDAHPVVEEMWPFPRPRRLRVVVWTDWMDGFRKGLTGWRRLLLPVWSRGIGKTGARLWPLVGGITVRVWPPAVLVKPPRVMKEADVRLGEQLFVHLDSLELKVRSVAAHELTHAYAVSRAALPPWLNEGIAMLTVDRFLGYPTVKAQTIEMLGSVDPPIIFYSQLKRLTDSELVKLYARGYWLTRYLLEEHPAVLDKLLSRRLGADIRKGVVARALGVPTRELWQHFDSIVFDHFHG